MPSGCRFYVARILIAAWCMKYGLTAAVVCLGLAVAPIAWAQEEQAVGSITPPVLNDQQLLRKYVWSTLGPPGVIGATFVSSFEQWRSYPPEWGYGASGFSKRWASQYAAAAIGNTTKYAVARMMHQDPSFTRCQCAGFGRRFRYALTSPFTARTRDGRRVFSVATIAAQVAEHVVPAVTWYPPGRVMSDGVGLAAAGVLSKMGVNVVREFVKLPRLPKKP
jgi:hypothetical protein